MNCLTASKLIKCNDFLNPKFISEKSRIQSFENKQDSFAQKTGDLASSGFFYIGPGDVVKCFSCGLQLGLWREKDDVEYEHKRWSPSCTFLNLSKIRLVENECQEECLQCIVCMKFTVNVIVLPCSHLKMCSNCGKYLNHCPVCRNVIKAFLRIYTWFQTPFNFAFLRRIDPTHPLGSRSILLGCMLAPKQCGKVECWY